MKNSYKHVPLALHTSYKIGGPARYFFEARSVNDVRDILPWIQEKNMDVFVLGGGTNILAHDTGFDGLVLKPCIDFLDVRENEVRVGAGVLMQHLLEFTAHKGLRGLEWAGGLPGTVGGAIRGNAGAFGGEMKDVVKGVRSVNIVTGKERVRENSECRFAYRSSIFKEEGKEIIVGATLSLAPGDPGAIRFAVQEKIDYRASRHPMEHPNIGSIFKNVPFETVPALHRSSLERVVKADPFPVVPTAHLVSEAGLKGVSRGGAMISPKHPNFIVNTLMATSDDVHGLIELVKQEVAEKFGISLEEEVLIFPESKPMS